MTYEETLEYILSGADVPESWAGAYKPDLDTTRRLAERGKPGESTALHTYRRYQRQR